MMIISVGDRSYSDNASRMAAASAAAITSAWRAVRALTRLYAWQKLAYLAAATRSTTGGEIM